MEEPGRWWSTSGKIGRTVVNAVLAVVVVVALVSMTQSRGRILLLPAGCAYVVNEGGQPEPTGFCEL